MPKTKAEVHEMRLAPAENGVLSETTHRTPRGGQGGGGDHDYSTKRKLHTDSASLHAHLKEIFGHILKHLPEEQAEIAEGGKEK